MSTESSTASWEEASRCPKCDNQGVKVAEIRLDRHQGKSITLECQHELCRWYKQRWIVQVKPDGSIPVRNNQRGESAFPKLRESSELAQQARDALAQLGNAAEVRPGS